MRVALAHLKTTPHFSTTKKKCKTIALCRILYASSLFMLGNFVSFFASFIIIYFFFSKWFFSKKVLLGIPPLSKNFDPNQAKHFVGLNLWVKTCRSSLAGVKVPNTYPQEVTLLSWWCFDQLGLHSRHLLYFFSWYCSFIISHK